MNIHLESLELRYENKQSRRSKGKGWWLRGLEELKMRMLEFAGFIQIAPIV